MEQVWFDRKLEGDEATMILEETVFPAEGAVCSKALRWEIP